MSKHTSEPWEAFEGDIRNNGRGEFIEIYGKDKEFIATTLENEGCLGVTNKQQANARRTVACVNACEGISTKAIEAGVIRALSEVCKELLTEVRKAGAISMLGASKELIKKSKQIIAKVEKH